jgi:hypothetical protein
MTKISHRLLYPPINQRKQTGELYTDQVIFTVQEDRITVFVQAYTWNSALARWRKERFLPDRETLREMGADTSGLYGIGTARDIWHKLRSHDFVDLGDCSSDVDSSSAD